MHMPNKRSGTMVAYCGHRKPSGALSYVSRREEFIVFPKCGGIPMTELERLIEAAKRGNLEDVTAIVTSHAKLSIKINEINQAPPPCTTRLSVDIARSFRS